MATHPLDYEQPRKSRWRQWLRRRRRTVIGLTMALVVMATLYYLRPWYIAFTEDQWESFSAMRTTRIGLGPFCVYSGRSAVPFERADLVEPLPEAVPGASNPIRPYRDVRNYRDFGLQVRCMPGLYRFHATRHALGFIEEHAMDLDRSTRTRLAKAIAEANVSYEGYGSQHLATATANAVRLLTEVRTQRPAPP